MFLSLLGNAVVNRFISNLMSLWFLELLGFLFLFSINFRIPETIDPRLLMRRWMSSWFLVFRFLLDLEELIRKTSHTLGSLGFIRIIKD